MVKICYNIHIVRVRSFIGIIALSLLTIGCVDQKLLFFKSIKLVDVEILNNTKLEDSVRLQLIYYLQQQFGCKIPSPNEDGFRLSCYVNIENYPTASMNCSLFRVSWKDWSSSRFISYLDAEITVDVRKQYLPRLLAIGMINELSGEKLIAEQRH